MVVVVNPYTPKDRLRVAIAATHIPKVWAQLQPAAVDNHPYKWEVLDYDLEVTLENGTVLTVWLFNMPTPPGAFAAGPTWEKRTYYRGGNSQRLREAIETALKESQKK
jgi:hypothetical protein